MGVGVGTGVGLSAGVGDGLGDGLGDGVGDGVGEGLGVAGYAHGLCDGVFLLHLDYSILNVISGTSHGSVFLTRPTMLGTRETAPPSMLNSFT